jgi:thiamine-phosphate pyrophosphorylase
MMGNLAAQLRLLLVVDEHLLGARDPVVLCTAAVRGGVTAVQLRCKEATDREMLRLARGLVAALPVPVFINDRADLALAAGAHGVHLGPDDLSPALVRRIVPPGFVIGASIGDPGEVERGGAADYWGIGPLHPTTTKPDAGRALEIDGARRLLALAGGRPAVVIGGVTPSDGAAVLAAGFAGVAVASGILMAEDPEASARRYR